MSQTIKPQQNISVKPGGHGFLGPDRWWHISFGGLMTIALVVFMVWSFGYVDVGANKVVLVLTVLFGPFMAFNIGGNDVANSFGTSVGAGTLSMKQALVIAAIFEVSGIVGAALTLGITTGTGGLEMVQWGEIGKIVMSWVLSPLLGGIVAWVLFGQIKKHILVYNEEMDVKLRELKRERAELRTKHKQAFERLDELQQISYTNAMARDASVNQRDDYGPEEFE